MSSIWRSRFKPPEGVVSPQAEDELASHLTNAILSINGASDNPLARRHLTNPDRLYAAGKPSPTRRYRHSSVQVSEACIPRSMKSNIVVEGAAIELEASVRDEAYRIAAEAVRNACIHSDGSILTIRSKYGRDLIIAVSDHGKGSDVLHMHEEKPRHDGVRGMYERARLGASLSIESIPDREITVTLRASGRLAYKDSSVIRTFRKMKDRFRGSAIDRGEQ